MNKILIGALAGLADLSLLANSVKTKTEVEWFFNQGKGSTGIFDEIPF